MQRQIATAEREKQRADRRPPRAGAGSRSTSPPANARPSSRAPRARSRPRSTTPRARRPRSPRWPPRRPTPSSAWPQPSSSQERRTGGAAQGGRTRRSMPTGKVAADSKTTLIVPSNMTETAALIASAMPHSAGRQILRSVGLKLRERPRRLLQSLGFRRWMSGLSRTPGKRVRVNSPPRVRIPPAPPESLCSATVREHAESPELPLALGLYRGACCSRALVFTDAPG